jgi:hypothetical protein
MRVGAASREETPNAYFTRVRTSALEFSSSGLRLGDRVRGHGATFERITECPKDERDLFVPIERMVMLSFRYIWIPTVTLLVATCISLSAASEPFTVSVEIGLATFDSPCSETREKVVVSPDKKYFFVYSERGRLDLNRVEGSLRVYRTTDLVHYVHAGSDVRRPVPTWTIRDVSSAEGPVFSHCRWLLESEAVVYLRRLPNGHHQIAFADIAKHVVRYLTPANQPVTDFDIRDAKNYAYTVQDQEPRLRRAAELRAIAIPVNGRMIDSLIFPESSELDVYATNRRYLWAVLDGKRFPVRTDGDKPVALLDNGGGVPIALAPRGDELISTVPVADVPKEWEDEYPPPFRSAPHHVQAGLQDPQSSRSARQYARINLKTGTIVPLTVGPTGNDAGWFSADSVGWSSDGRHVVLSDAYLATVRDEKRRPCIAVIDLKLNTHYCVELFRALTETGFEEGNFIPRSVRFVTGTTLTVRLVAWDRASDGDRTIEYKRLSSGGWTRRLIPVDTLSIIDGMQLSIEEGLNEPPRLVARLLGTPHIIWDPNPQLANAELNRVTPYRWSDGDGREWRGGLYWPTDYESGRRYPLVVQTHGFDQSAFLPSGKYTTAFAARALANAGFFVLQVDEHVCPGGNRREEPCIVGGYDAGIAQLSSDGLVDPENVGIVGFSRTCLHVVEALAHGNTKFKAASLTDGVMLSYLQYLAAVDFAGNTIAREADAMIGAPPFGEGLKEWLENSPLFGLEGTTAAVQIVGLGRSSLLWMWEPYARLRYLNKPVDAVLLRTDEHVLTNPRARLASQGGTVDWFRFWLKNEADPAPEKAEQYRRWRQLRTNQPKGAGS